MSVLPWLFRLSAGFCGMFSPETLLPVCENRIFVEERMYLRGIYDMLEQEQEQEQELY